MGRLQASKCTKSEVSVKHAANRRSKFPHDLPSPFPVVYGLIESGSPVLFFVTPRLVSARRPFWFARKIDGLRFLVYPVV